MSKKMILLICIFVSSLAFAKKETVNLEVTDKGFVPNEVNVAPDTDLTLNIKRISDATCATEIEIPSKKISKKLPLNTAVVVHVGKLKKGEVRFGCAMKMMEGGKIYVK